MANLTLRSSKGSELTHQELDDNFSNINTELVSKVATVAGTAGRITSTGTTAKTLDLASGVATAGTYTSVTVDTYGRVTTGSNPTPALATAASTVTLTADNTTNATNYPTFVSAATGNLSPRTDTGFTYNPSTGALTATTFVGALSGNATTATSATSATTASSAATLTTARTINGVSFNGSANITVTANTTNTLTIGTGLSGTSFNGNAATTIALASGVATAGTYQGSVTIDTYGRVTSGSNSLVGYNEGSVYDNGTTSTPTINVANGNIQKITLNGSWTFSGFTSPVAGQSVTLLITQDATGSRTFTTSTITAKWANGSTASNKALTTAANSLDLLYVFYDGTQYLFSLAKGFQ